MRLRLEIDGSGAAFDARPATELARLLRETADRIADDGDSEGVLRDINGNYVGEWRVR